MYKSEISPKLKFEVSIDEMAQYLCGLYKAANFAHSHNYRNDAAIFMQRAWAIENFLHTLFGITFMRDYDENERISAIVACDKGGYTIKAYQVSATKKGGEF